MNELWIPILGIFAVFGAPITIVWLALKAYSQKRALMHDTINKLIEKGQPVPADLIKAFEAKKPMNHVQVGVILLSTGIGLGIFLWVLTNLEIASVAAIPLCLGIGFLILSRLGSAEPSEAANPA